MTIDLAALRGRPVVPQPCDPPAARVPPGTHDLHVPLLARLIVEFDPLLADEVREHLEARASSWDPRGGQAAAPDRLELAARYRMLAALIESIAPMRLSDW